MCKDWQERTKLIIHKWYVCECRKPKVSTEKLLETRVEQDWDSKSTAFLCKQQSQLQNKT